MKKNKKSKSEKLEVINIVVKNNEDAEIVRRAWEILKVAGYTICKNDCLILEPDFFKQ